MPVFHTDAPNVHRPDGRQIYELIAEARHALDILERGHHPEANNPTRIMAAAELVDLARQRRRTTGLPTTTRREGGGGSVVDDQGVPMPPLSDPVGEIVAAALSDSGPIDTLLATVLRSMRSAVDQLRTATGTLAKATPTPDVAPEGDPGCKVHATYGKWEPVYRSERCRWDYDFWIANKVDTPEPIMQARLDGKRITEAMVEQALAPPAHNKRLRKTRAHALTRE